MKQPTIDIRNLSIGYSGRRGAKVIAENINATICSGELTCLLGANGAGKSTLLRTLSAFLPSLSGEILIQQRVLTQYSDKELSKLIGVVLTEKCHLRNMTVGELVAMGRSPYTGFWGMLTSHDRRIVDESIEMVGIGELKDRMVHTLSDGERQKVMIAKALSQQTPIIFLDEPTAFLDYPSKVEILHLLHRLSREMAKTIFLSTHDLELALQIADKVWLMDRQRGVEIGTPEDLALNGGLERFFAHRRGVAFEPTTGLYRIDNEYHTEVRVEGSSVRCAMVRKALRRNGIIASECASSHITICVDEPRGEYLITLADGASFRLSTIEALLAMITNQIETTSKTK